MLRTTTFTKGSGVYRCRVCTRRTRDDGNGDSVHIQLCTQCYDLCGWHNRVQDGGTLSEQQKAECRALVKSIQDHGGRPDDDHVEMSKEQP